MDAHPKPVASATDEADRDARQAALFRILADGHPHRLADLSGKFAITASRVSTDLAELQSLGMPMRLDADDVEAPACVALDGAAIEAALERLGSPRNRWEVRVAFSLASTNTVLLREVKTRNRGPRLLAAEFQRAGRGRLGRDWASAPGSSLTVSFALRIGRGIALLDGVTLVCGLAVQRVVADEGVTARLKWPNDVLVDGRKLAGILVEAQASGAGTMLVIGVGINVGPAAAGGTQPLDLRRACLQEEESGTIDRNRLIARLARALEAHLAAFDLDGFSAFAARWNAEDAFRDQRVTLHSAPMPSIVGIARGVDDSGALLLDVDGECRRVIAGDVSLRPVQDAE